MTWNRTSQPLTVKDESLATFDQKNDYDLLRRLGIRTEGTLTGASITTQSRKQTLARDIGGRTVADQVTLNSDSDYTDGPPNAIDGGELDDDRTYNKRNELIGRSVNDYDNPSSPRTVTLAYDNNGNLIDDGEKHKYVYNPFGQLVQITLQNDDPIAVYTYNGLGQRISEQLDTNTSNDNEEWEEPGPHDTGEPDGEIDEMDPIFYLALDQHGRRIATFRGQDAYPKEVFVWHPTGLTGPAFKGGLLMRDRNDSLVDPTLWALEEAGYDRLERHYACSDFRGDVVATVAPSGLEFGGVLVERTRYTATGIPFGLPLGDIDCNGVTSTATDDQTKMATLLGAGGYSVLADLNLDGYVDTDDDTILAASNGLYAGHGRLSVPGVGSRVGYRQMEMFGEGFGVVWKTTRKSFRMNDAIWQNNEPIRMSFIEQRCRVQEFAPLAGLAGQATAIASSLTCNMCSSLPLVGRINFEQHGADISIESEQRRSKREPPILPTNPCDLHFCEVFYQSETIDFFLSWLVDGGSSCPITLGPGSFTSPTPEPPTTWSPTCKPPCVCSPPSSPESRARMCTTSYESEIIRSRTEIDTNGGCCIYDVWYIRVTKTERCIGQCTSGFMDDPRINTARTRLGIY